MHRDVENVMTGNIRVLGKIGRKTGNKCVLWGKLQSNGGSGQALLRRGAGART